MARTLRGPLTGRSGRWPRLDPAITAAGGAWLAARVAVALGFLVAHGAVDVLRPGAPPVPLAQGLVAWDGAFYRDIATIGYGALPEEALRFFPLFPMLGRLVGAPLPGGATAGLVVVANLSALVAGYLLYRLARLEGGRDQVGREVGGEVDGRSATAVWLLALTPAAAVLALAYTEALFLALTIGAFLALRSGRWWVVVVLGVAAGLCRPSGVVLVVPVLIEAARGLRQAPTGERLVRLAACLAPVAGVAGYLVWVGRRFGDALAPMEVQGSGELRGAWVDPVSRVIDALRDAPEEGLLGEALHLPWIVLLVGLAVVAARRLPSSYTAYSVAILLVALSADSLGSFERYGLTAFPLAMAAASVLVRTPWERPVLAGLAAGLSAFTAMILLGVFVP